MKRAFYIVVIMGLLALTACMPTPGVDSEIAPASVQTPTSITRSETSVISGNTTVTQPNYAAYTNADGSKDYLQIGFALMKNEKIGGVYCAMSEADVIKLFGEPSSKKAPELWGADDLYHWDYVYAAIGLTVNFQSEDGKSGTVSSYTVNSDAFQGSTTGNIRIGSTRQAVLDAYKEEINSTETAMLEDSDNSLVAGSLYGGMIFHFSGSGEVDSIFVGASAE